MSSLSRRHFLYAGGAAAAGAAASTTMGGVSSAAAPGTAAVAAGSVDVAEEVLVPEGSDHLVVYVSNTGLGEVTVMTDGEEVVFHDPQLVARVQRAAKRARV